MRLAVCFKITSAPTATDLELMLSLLFWRQEDSEREESQGTEDIKVTTVGPNVCVFPTFTH